MRLAQSISGGMLILMIYKQVESSSQTLLGPYFATVLGPTGVQIFHRWSLYFRKISSRDPYISAFTLNISSGGSIFIMTHSDTQ